MQETKKITRFQVVRCMVRRDGLHLKAVGPLYHSVKEAMAQVVELERENELFVYFRIRGLAKGDPESLEGFRPFLKDRRPVKLYALKVSPYPEGKEPAGHLGPSWTWAWGRSESEARGSFRHSSPQYRAYHIFAAIQGLPYFRRGGADPGAGKRDPADQNRLQVSSTDQRIRRNVVK